MDRDAVDSVSYVQVLDANGDVTGDVDPPKLSDEQLVQMYQDMVFARHFDERTVSLQRQGRMGTYPPMAGHEGAQVGSAHALNDDDWVFYQYREHAIAFVRGIDPKYILLYWKGHPEGNAGLEERNIFPINVPIASHVPHAVGMAWASTLRKETGRAFVCHFGDGATSEGDFHEGLNLAGVFDTPNVFYCNNNQWAISVPTERQTASATFAQKADAYGFEGVRVDGMDPLAVYKVSKEALEIARDGGSSVPRPTLIETVLYRYGAHTTADDPSVYRDDDVVEQWKARDPIDRLERYLLGTGRLSSERISAIEIEVRDVVATAIDETESLPDLTSDEMFEHVYDTIPERLEQQRAYLDHLQE